MRIIYPYPKGNCKQCDGEVDYPFWFCDVQCMRAFETEFRVARKKQLDPWKYKQV